MDELIKQFEEHDKKDDVRFTALEQKLELLPTKKENIACFQELIKNREEQDEIRLQAISGHYSDVLLALKDLKVQVDKSSAFITRMEPVEAGLITMQNLVRIGRYLGLPAIGILLMWLYNKFI